MNKTLSAVKRETQVAKWDFDVEVVETRAAWDRWKGLSLTWRSSTASLAQRLWSAHLALEARKGKHDPSTHSIAEFCERIGMDRRTFGHWMDRIKEMMDGGIDVMQLPGDMKMAQLEAPKSPRVVELEEQVSRMETEIAKREKALESRKEHARDQAIELETLRKENAKLEKSLKRASSEGAEPSPELKKKIADLEKRREALESETAWLSTASSFKSEVVALMEVMEQVKALASRLMKPRVKVVKKGAA